VRALKKLIFCREVVHWCVIACIVIGPIYEL
jgi:hypothetical protein